MQLATLTVFTYVMLVEVLKKPTLPELNSTPEETAEASILSLYCTDYKNIYPNTDPLIIHVEMLT